MIKLHENGVYLVNGTEIIEDSPEAAVQIQAKAGFAQVTREKAKQGTIAYGILKDHNCSKDIHNLQIKFDKLTSHDITFVGIIQTARAVYAQLAVRSMRMITCLGYPVLRNTVVSMFRRIRRSFINLPGRCWQPAVQ